MSNTWETIIGNYQTLNTSKLRTDLGRAYLLAVTYRKDMLVSRLCEDDDNKKYICYETFQEAIDTTTKKDAKPKFTGKKKVKVGEKLNAKGDKMTPVYELQEGVEQAKRKFLTLTVDLKSSLWFLLNMYIKQCHDCFMENDKSFQDEKEVLNQICLYSQAHHEVPIVLSIVRVSEIVNIREIIKSGYGGINKKIIDGCASYFVNTNTGLDYSEQLKLIVAKFVDFINLLALLSTDILFENHTAVSKKFLYGVYRQISTLLESAKYKEFDPRIMDYLDEFIENERPKKEDKAKTDDVKTETKTKSKKKDESNEEGAGEDEEGDGEDAIDKAIENETIEDEPSLAD